MSPNLHIILLHFPLALLIVGTLIELLAFLWRKSSARIAAKWMIGLGALIAVPTTAAGFYELWRANHLDAEPKNSQTWHEIRASSPVQGDAWTALRCHAVTDAAATGALLLVVMIWLGSSDTARSRLQIPLLLIVAACAAAICYDYARFGANNTISPHYSTTQALHYARVSPLQLHIIGAGVVIALAAASLGLTFRAAGSRRLVLAARPGDEDYAAAFVPHAPRAREFDRPPPIPPQRVPAARFWLLCTLVALATAAAGLWTLATFTDTWTPRGLYDQIVQLNTGHRPQITRRFAHVATGSTIILLTLLLAMVRRRFPAAVFGLLLALAFALQIWLGSLLLLDSPNGPITHFNSSAQPTTQPIPDTPTSRPPPTRPATQPNTAPVPIARTPL